VIDVNVQDDNRRKVNEIRPESAAKTPVKTKVGPTFDTRSERSTDVIYSLVAVATCNPRSISLAPDPECGRCGCGRSEREGDEPFRLYREDDRRVSSKFLLFLMTRTSS
jgi:hypothetical protein